MNADIKALEERLVDAAAKFLRESHGAGKNLTPWQTTVKSTKKKWLVLAAGVLSLSFVFLRAKDDALASAIAERDAERKHAEDGEALRIEERRLRQAAEARLEELTRERDEAKAHIDEACGLLVRAKATAHSNLNKQISAFLRAFLHQGGSE